MIVPCCIARVEPCNRYILVNWHCKLPKKYHELYDGVPVVVFEEPVFGKNFTSNPDKRKRALKSDSEKEPTIKRLKSEFAKFTAQSSKEKKNYRYSKIVELGGVAEKDKTMPLPLKRKIEAAKKKRLLKDVELGKLDAKSLSKSKKKDKNRSRKKKRPGV
ncbi:hypothetical protein ACHWQZ_G015184 [Mnemiopsis leidyi]